METALRVKFKQNPAQKEFLCASDMNLLIKANPTDTYWSSGLSLFSKDVWNPNCWVRNNILGNLMKIHEEVFGTPKGSQ